jgi:hypothetical protein
MTFKHGIKKSNNNNKHNIIYLFIFSQNNSYGSAIGSPKQRERKKANGKGANGRHEKENGVGYKS